MAAKYFVDTCKLEKIGKRVKRTRLERQGPYSKTTAQHVRQMVIECLNGHRRIEVRLTMDRRAYFAAYHQKHADDPAYQKRRRKNWNAWLKRVRESVSP